MGNTIKIPLALGSDADFSKKANDSQLLNLFVHPEAPGSKTPYVILNTSGLKKVIELPDKIYGLYVFKQRLYAVTQSALYHVDLTDNVNVKLGDISVGGYCSFADNGIEMVFASGGQVYSYNPDTNVVSTVDIISNSVSFKDGYFIFNKNGTGRFYVSDLYSTTIDPLMYATAESNSDNLLAARCTPREVWLLGERSIEVWYDAGTSDFPFARITGALMNLGIIEGTDSLMRESIYFVGNDYKVYETAGYSVRPISTAAVEKRIFENREKPMHGFSFIEYGHYFYALTIEGVTTYVYDVATMQWHERKSHMSETWKVNGVQEYQDKLLAFADNVIYDMSLYYYDEDGKNLTREIISLPINHGGDRIRILELEMQMDISLEKEGTFYLRTTKDSGYTWSGRYGATTGKIGHRKTRVRWTRLGQFREVALRIYTYDPIPVRIVDMVGRIVA